MEKGIYTFDSALELLEDFFLSFNKDSDIYVGVQQGDNGQSMMLGGIDENGNDVFNLLSELCLKASYNNKMIDPKINLRVNKNTPKERYTLASHLTKAGLGFPQYSNDDIVIPALEKLGYEKSDATEYTVAACWEFIIPGKGMDIPNIGTTHADYFYKDIPCTQDMTEKEVKGEYELETGNVIVHRFEGINPDHTPGVLVKNHGPFSWGTSPANAVYNAKVMEQCAKMAYISFTLNPDTTMNPLLVEKHYMRKHGPNAYYGQKKK